MKWLYSLFCTLVFSPHTIIPSVFLCHICWGDMQPFLSANLFCVTSVSQFLLILSLSLIFSSDSPGSTSFTVSLLHALPIALSVLFYSSISLESTCTSITLYVYLCPSRPTHAYMQQPLISASNLFFYFAPISSPPWDSGPTS